MFVVLRAATSDVSNQMADVVSIIDEISSTSGNATPRRCAK
jgi:hypothetical protein